jgi:hypothetical protein
VEVNVHRLERAMNIAETAIHVQRKTRTTDQMVPVNAESASEMLVESQSVN